MGPNSVTLYRPGTADYLRNKECKDDFCFGIFSKPSHTPHDDGTNASGEIRHLKELQVAGMIEASSVVHYLLALPSRGQQIVH